MCPESGAMADKRAFTEIIYLRVYTFFVSPKPQQGI